MVMRDRRLEVPYENPEDAQAREDRELGVNPMLFGAARRLSRQALREARDAKKVTQKAAPAPQKPPANKPTPETSKNEKTFNQAFSDARKSGKSEFNWNGKKYTTELRTKPAIASKSAGEYVAPSPVESALTAGIQGLEGGPSGMSAEREMETGRTIYFGESPEAVVEVAKGMRKGLFGEEISQEDYDAMTRRSKEATPFYGQFLKKGGQVKKTKKYASGGTVSSASKRGDGCAQRGKTKGRMV